MGLPIYLAMTAWEMSHLQKPEHCGWMACHFSAYGSGLSNIPTQLPPNSLLILNDRMPPAGHDPELITRQVCQTVEELHCCGVLLDLQRPYCLETAKIAAAICAGVPCPVAVTSEYVRDCDCGVFLPPVPPYRTLTEHITPWKGRQLWLEIDTGQYTMELTEQGCKIFPGAELGSSPIHQDTDLHCHYSIRQEQDRAVFSLTRTTEDLQALLEEAQQLEIFLCTGLYQELEPVLFVPPQT